MIAKSFALQHRCTNIIHDSYQRITTSFLENGQILVKNSFFLWDQKYGKLYLTNSNYYLSVNSNGN